MNLSYLLYLKFREIMFMDVQTLLGSRFFSWMTMGQSQLYSRTFSSEICFYLIYLLLRFFFFFFFFNKKVGAITALCCLPSQLIAVRNINHLQPPLNIIKEKLNKESEGKVKTHYETKQGRANLCLENFGLRNSGTLSHHECLRCSTIINKLINIRITLPICITAVILQKSSYFPGSKNLLYSHHICIYNIH